MEHYRDRSTWLLVWTITVFFGCERNITVDLPNKEVKLVVNSISNRDSTTSPLIERFELGKSRSILEPVQSGTQTQRETFFTKEGIFFLYANDILFDTLTYDNVLGYYPRRNFFSGTIKKYTIKGGAPGFPQIEASSIIPAYIPVKVLTYKPKARKKNDGTLLDEVTISFNDPPNENNFYGVYFKKANQNNSWSPVFCFSSKDRDLDEVREKFDPIDPDPCLESAMLTDLNFNGSEKTLKFEIPSADMNSFVNTQTGAIMRPLIRLEHITEDYYRYIKSRNRNISVQGNPFAEPVNVYTNVKNGYGIFTFYTSSEQEIK